MSVARRHAGWFRSAVVCGTLLAAAALSLPAAQRAAARPYDDPATPTVPLSDMLTQLHTLYLGTETATEAYNQAKETAGKQRAQAERIDRQLADQRAAVAASKDQLGVMARQMYRDGGVSPYLSLLSGQTPQDFFGQRHVLGMLAGHQKDLVGELSSGETRLDELNTQAQRALDRAQHAQNVAAAHKKDVETHLRDVEAMLAGLTGVQIAELQSLEQKDADQAQKDFLDSKALGSDPALRAPSTVGDRAIGYAFQQLGKPYVWGAQGPGSFDCSGLTSQAWAHAGVTVPRTSQEQWARLPHVPLSLLRPGDLVVYFSGATHVAIYIGDGLVIQAPRPGSYVKVSPIAANPILGAVRPDLGRQALSDYRPRPVPKQAQAPTPIGVEVKAPADGKVTKGAKAADDAKDAKDTKDAKGKDDAKDAKSPGKTPGRAPGKEPGKPPAKDDAPKDPTSTPTPEESGAGQP